MNASPHPDPLQPAPASTSALPSSLDVDRWRRAQHLFDRLVDLPPEQRGIELAAHCDDEHVAAMVVGLFATDAEDLHEPVPAIAQFARIVDPELPPGARIGAFRVERVLGCGGMGRVYLGRRVDGRVEQEVAIKTVRGAIGGADLLRRFARERRILARLQHPNIAHFVDAGECADGAPFFAMEYIAGTPLLEYAAQHRLDLTARLKLFVKVAGAVDYAHRQLIVHRDLKPGNVLVDAAGTPKLLDFGIAKSIQQQHEQRLLEGHTAPEARYLSLCAAAPERFSGDNDSVSLDIYALGAMLYELLAGQPPLALDQLSVAEAQARILHEMPRAPSELVAAGIPYAGANLRGDLDRILLHVLKKEPEQRYASAAALLEDLQRVLEHRPISLRASHRWYLAARFLRRHRVAAVMAAALLLTTVGAAVVYREQRDLAVHERTIAVQERTRAEVVNAILIEAFESADPSRNKGERLSARDVLKQARHAVAKRTDLDGTALTALLVSLSEVHHAIGLPADALQLAQQAMANASTDKEQLLAGFRYATAQFAMSQGAAAKQTVERLRALPTVAADPRWRISLDLLALDIESYLGTVDTLPLAEQLYTYAQQTLSPDDDMVEEVATLYASRLVARANRVQEGALLVRRLLGRHQTDVPTAQRADLLKLAARVERQLGNFPEALGFARRNLELVERLYGKEHGMYVAAESQCARMLLLVGEAAASRTMYTASVERALRVYGADSAIYAAVAHNAGDAALLEPLDLQRALTMTAIAVDVGPRVVPAESRQMGFLWSTRATALLLAGENAAALDAASRSSTIFRASLAHSKPMHAEVELLAAVAEQRLQRADAAQARIRALGSAIDVIDPDSHALVLARALKIIPGATP